MQQNVDKRRSAGAAGVVCSAFLCKIQKLSQVAHVFVKMANLVILSRGMNIFSDDFKYYSPGTGKLSRDGFLRLTKTLDVAFSSFRVEPTDFVVSCAASFAVKTAYQ